jgi:FixJ family two-component response regulator
MQPLILIVDDDAELSSMLVELLEHSMYWKHVFVMV